MSIFLINYTSVTLVSLNGYKQRLPFCERGREKTPHLQSRRSSSRKWGASKSFSVILRDKEAPLLVNNVVESLARLGLSTTKRGSGWVKTFCKIGLGRFVPRLSLFHSRWPHPLLVSIHLCISQKTIQKIMSLIKQIRVQKILFLVFFRAPPLSFAHFLTNDMPFVRPSHWG